MKIYKSYNFRTKDPAIDELATVIKDANGGKPIKHHHLTKIERDGGPSASALAACFFGKTLRPRNATIEAAGRTLGLKRIWVRDNGPPKRRA